MGTFALTPSINMEQRGIFSSGCVRVYVGGGGGRGGEDEDGRVSLFLLFFWITNKSALVSSL